jgi:uncharacterized YigZ family protein
MQDNPEFFEYKTIRSESTAVFRDRNSRFIAHAFHVESEDDIAHFLTIVKKQYYDARHFCYAYILGPHKEKWRANDDGEPSGSAGLPIYNQCLSFDLTNVFVVVVRYFGGTKLGVPGLINAYKTSTRMALDEAEILNIVPSERLKIKFAYALMNDVMTYVKANDFDVVSKDFQIDCTIELNIPIHKKNELKNHFNPFSVELFWGTE